MLYASHQPSILGSAIPSLAYITLPQLIGNNAADSLIEEATIFINDSNAAYKEALEMQLAYLTREDSNVGQMVSGRDRR